VFPSEPLSSAEAAVFETFVVPRYLELFSALALEMLLPTEGARIAHLGCRTGTPDTELCQRIPRASVYSVDSSIPAIDLARNKAGATGAMVQYLQEDALPSSLPDAVFSHVLCLHPVVAPSERGVLFAEAARLLYSGGQVLVGLPLRGSFQELADLLREYALKHDVGELGRAVEEGMQNLPTLETLSEELEVFELEDVDVEVRQTTLEFDSGRGFFEDPVARLLVLPMLTKHVGEFDLRRPLDYLREAIDKYWSETCFELTVNVGCASARLAE